VKGAFASTDDVKADAARGVFTYVLTNVLRLLHPFMPFVTEELHAALVGEDAITAPWPQADGSHSDLAAEQEFGFLMSVVSALRRFRADHQLQPGIRPGASATISDTRLAGTLSSELERVTTLARWGRLDLREDELQSPAARIVVPGAVIEVPLAGIVDIDAERARLNREVAALGNEAEGVRRKLANADFVAKAPDEVVEAQRDRLADLEGRQRELRRALEELG
jgi:valyl-tRNA synthetase